ncbi:hypothetical protein GCM10017576_19250 [Microbacterium barkeri]|uniref:Uncharacterized protein n=1 Tax=Microbacterium barkeri TaxID=33917 RepID=A0A9W6LX30_9MICO|nr:hypothetical protein GCM10017576_19250 [Microbacterium barkeri]
MRSHSAFASARAVSGRAATGDGRTRSAAHVPQQTERVTGVQPRSDTPASCGTPRSNQGGRSGAPAGTGTAGTRDAASEHTGAASHCGAEPDRHTSAGSAHAPRRARSPEMT